jgi:hypothetical protein
VDLGCGLMDLGELGFRDSLFSGAGSVKFF